MVAFGMESADPQVIAVNNLNAQPEQVMSAIELVNEIGRERGTTGLPKVLPGLNFIAGLNGETAKTFKLNLDFLNEVKSKGLFLRRINIRQVAMTRKKFKSSKHHSEFLKFKKEVREKIDRPMLEEIVPAGSILRDVF